MSDDILYVIDTSSLIDLHRWRPISRNRKIWQRLDGLVNAGDLISPDEVHEELIRGKDALTTWSKNYKREKRMFKTTTRQIVGRAKQIIHQFPELADIDKPAADADPFVIALACHEREKLLSVSCTVITNEKYTPFGRPRIPHVCDAFKLPYMSIHQLYLTLGWSFEE